MSQSTALSQRAGQCYANGTESGARFCYHFSHDDRDHRTQAAGRARNLVERFFNKIKHCRRVATRYDKLAANYLAFVQLASIRLWLRVNESTS
jgi:transposase